MSPALVHNRPRGVRIDLVGTESDAELMPEKVVVNFVATTITAEQLTWRFRKRRITTVQQTITLSD